MVKACVDMSPGPHLNYVFVHSRSLETDAMVQHQQVVLSRGQCWYRWDAHNGPNWARKGRHYSQETTVRQSLLVYTAFSGNFKCFFFPPDELETLICIYSVSSATCCWREDQKVIAAGLFPSPMLHTAPSYAQSHTLGQTHVLLWFLVSDTTDCGDWLVFLIHLLQISVRNFCLEPLPYLYFTERSITDYKK